MNSWTESPSPGPIRVQGLEYKNQMTFGVFINVALVNWGDIHEIYFTYALIKEPTDRLGKGRVGGDSVCHGQSNQIPSLPNWPVGHSKTLPVGAVSTLPVATTFSSLCLGTLIWCGKQFGKHDAQYFDHAPIRRGFNLIWFAGGQETAAHCQLPALFLYFILAGRPGFERANFWGCHETHVRPAETLLAVSNYYHIIQLLNTGCEYGAFGAVNWAGAWSHFCHLDQLIVSPPAKFT